RRGRGRLARTGFSDDRERLALKDVEAHAVQNLARLLAAAEGDLQVADADKRCVHRCALAFGSTASRNSSPREMNASTVIVNARDGQNSAIGAVRMLVCAWLMSLPHDIVAPPRPTPRNDSTDSATIAAARLRVATTMTGAIALGSTWLSMVRNR